MTQWTSQQLTCLKALGVPVYTHIPAQPAPPAVSDTKTTTPDTPQTQATPDPTTNTEFYYKLGPWVLAFSQTIPVDSYDWLRDLAAYCNSKPTQVNRTSNPVRTNKYARNQLNADDKKALWKALKAHL